jgi:hypothetical protein
VLGLFNGCSHAAILPECLAEFWNKAFFPSAGANCTVRKARKVSGLKLGVLRDRWHRFGSGCPHGRDGHGDLLQGATPLGLGISSRGYPGAPALRGNPGLEGAIPLGLGEYRAEMKCSRALSGQRALWRLGCCFGWGLGRVGG